MIETELPVPPGATILEQMEEQHVSVEDMARKLDLTTDQTKNLIAGEAVLMQATAKCMEELGMATESFWMNLELQYRKSLFSLPVEVNDETGRIEMYEVSFLNDYIPSVFKAPEAPEKSSEKDEDNLLTKLCNRCRMYHSEFKSKDGLYTANLTSEVTEDYFGNLDSMDELVFTDQDDNEVIFKYIEDDITEFFCELSRYEQN